MRIFLIATAVVLLGSLGLSSLYAVDRGEFVYVTQFGQFVAVHDGAADGGLHAKLPWPVQSVQEAICDRIRSERQKKVADYQSEGARLAADSKSDAERKSRETLAEARAEEQRIKGTAEVEADRIRNQAHGKDPEFYAFLKKL